MNRFYRHILCVMLTGFLALHAQAQVKSTNVQSIDGKKFYIHKIEKSQSLYAISKVYAVSVDELYKFNPELKAGARAGQEIKIPFQQNSPAPQPAATASLSVDTTKYLTHRVAKGETMYSITRKFNLSEKELNALNPSLAQGIKEGQLIVVGEKGKKKNPVKELRELRQVIAPKEKPSLIIDSALFRPQSKPVKPEYRVALMLPFKLDQTLQLDIQELARTNGNFPAVPSLAVDFYLGFKRAVDSLRAPGFDVHLDLQDVDDKDTGRVSSICNEGNFKDFDMIFGPIYANCFKTMSRKAREAGIPIVSPTTTENKILYNNIYISKTTPSVFTLMEGLADFCMDSLALGGANIMLVTLNDKDKKELAFVAAFKKYYNDRVRNSGRPLKDTIQLVRGVNGVKASYKQNMRNVAVCLNKNPVFFTDFATQIALFSDRNDMTLCGWESITELDNIDQSYLNRLHYTFAHNYNLNNTDAYKPIIDDYTRVQDTYPGEYYFIGFDIAMYYLKKLKEQGPDFVHKLDKLPGETGYMRFKFTRPDLSTGFDNRGLYIFRYNDFHITSTGWK